MRDDEDDVYVSSAACSLIAQRKLVGGFWLRHITVREGFGCNTQQLGSSFYCNTLQFKLGSQCGVRDLDR